jgi:lysozyme
MIKNHEGLRLERYICPTGHPTIGYGHTGIHVQKGRITQAEADQIFEEDFIKYSALAQKIPEFSSLDPARQGALIDLVYNLGYKGFMNFQKTRQALATQNWSEAASELLNSRYARQVGRRAQTIANIFKTGQLGNMPSTISPTGATSVIASEADSVQGVPTQPINIASTGSNIIANLLRGSGRISSKFGMRTHPVDKTQKLHKGIDVAAGAGTPIISPWPGKVIINKNNPKGYGWYTVIDHGNFATLYGHMSQQSPLAVGSQVNTGDVIGMVGSTGASTGPHLHFEVRPGSGNYFNRSPVDPLTFTGATLPSSAMDAVDTAAQEMTQQTHITPPQIKPGSEAFKRLNINNLNKVPQQISKQITPQAIKAIQKPVLPTMKTPTVVSDPINDRFNQLVQQYGLNDPDKQAKLDQKYNTLVTSKGIGGLDSFIPSINFGGIGNNLLGRVAGLTSQIPMMKTLSSLEDQDYLANVLQGTTGSGEGNTNNTNNINANTAQPNIIIINQNTSSMANSSQSLASEQHNNGSKSSAANIFGTW